MTGPRRAPHADSIACPAEKPTHARQRSFLGGLVARSRGNRGRCSQVLAAATWCAVAVASPAMLHAAPTPILKGPYLQELGTTGVTVRAELDSPATATVEVTHEGDDAIIVDEKGARTFHSLRIDKLKPLTHYRYAFRTGGGATIRGEFTTAPPDDSARPFTFLVYGDNRSDDAGHALVVRAMMQTPADFLLHTGDFVQSGGNPLDWQSFFDIERPMLTNRCLFSCVGNHELFSDEGAVNYTRYFAPSTDGRLYATFRWGSARFFLLNAFHDWNGGDERAWLDKALTSADTEAGLVWRIAVVHHGPWSSGPHGSSPTLVSAHIPQLLARHRIDLIVSGHDHIYERGDAAGVRYIVSGGGGAPVYRDIKRLASTRKVEATHHFVEVTVESDSVKLVTKRSDGSLLERCGFTKTPGWDCDGVAAGAPPMGAPPSASGGAAASTSAAFAAPSSSPATVSRCGCRVAGVGGTWEIAPFAALALSLFLARRKTR